MVGWGGAPGGPPPLLKKLSPMPYVPRRQPTQVWKPFWASRFPPFLKDFVYQALWAKLKVGERLQNWTKFPWCPICASLETVDHALQQCRFHAMAWDTIDYYWGPSYVEGVSDTVRALPLKHSFSRPQGITKWAAQAAHWSLCNQAKNGFSAPSLEHFLSQWIRVLSQLILWEPLQSLSGPLSQFHNVVATLSQFGVLPGIAIRVTCDDSSLSERATKKQKTQERKQQLAAEAKQVLAELEGEGWILAFTDGSTKQHPKVGWVAGYGCVVMGIWEAKGFLPPNSRQTNNRAERLAEITVLEDFLQDQVRLAVVMDSQYVYDGLRGSAFRWRTAGWAVCNVDLWIRALDLVDKVSATLKWIRVPSHTGIPGNERADVLAEEGRVSSPLYHVLSLPDRPIVSLELPATPTPRRALAVPRSMELHDVITPSGDTPSLCRMHAHEPKDTKMVGISRKLDSSESRHSMTSSEEHLSSCTVSLDSNTPSSAGQVYSDCGSTKGSSGTLSHGDSNSTISINSSDIASTASLHDSDIIDDPQNTWENLGLVELETPVRPRQRRRLNTPSTDVSTRSCLNSPRISFSSGCHTPVTNSD